MTDKTAIEWTDATWNPVTGCTEVSLGCDHCYAKTFAERWRSTPGHYFEHGFDVQIRPDKLDQPLRWRRPRRIFVNSMADLFHDQVPEEYIAKVFAIMLLAQRHTFQVLTKRHGRMRSLLNSHAFWTRVLYEALDPALPAGDRDGLQLSLHYLPNVWLGVSTENQQWADIRIPALLDTPAAVRFISAEPLLGPIDFRRVPGFNRVGLDLSNWWVIVGGESGPGARPMHPDWARSLRDQCTAAGVPFLFKQWGEYSPLVLGDDGTGTYVSVDRESGVVETENVWGQHHGGRYEAMRRVGKKRAGRELDGRTWDQYPVAVTL